MFALAAVAVTTASSQSVSEAATFSYTGAEQVYTVPAGVASVRITAVGANGGDPGPGNGVPGGRGAIVSGVVAVTGGQTLYVHVGGPGGRPDGGYNGGGNGGITQNGTFAWGGGGASDVSTMPSAAGPASLQSRLIVAAGGGGSAGIAAGGGDAGGPGGCCGAVGHGPNAAQPGTQTSGGAGACSGIPAGCGGNGSLGRGGAGGASGTGADTRTGGGGGGGLYGGGGGAGHVSDQGGGAGGSSKVQAGGSVGVAQSTAVPSSVDIEPYTTTENSRRSDPTKLLKVMPTQLFFLYFPTHPERSTRLESVRLDSVPRGSKVFARCTTRTGNACKGRLRKSLTRRRARGSLRIKAFEQRYPAGTRLRVVIKHADYITQVMILEIRRGKGPRLRSRCQAPDTGRLKRC